jgi:hypothetical protein
VAAETSSGDRENSYAAQPADENLPRPDPTRLTTQLVDRALSAFREVMETRLKAMDKAILLAAKRIDTQPREDGKARAALQADIDGKIQSLRELLESRLSAMDKATELLAATVGRVPSDTDKAVGALRELLGARIDGMDIATKLLASTVDTIPTDVDRAVASVRQFIEQQIRNVQDVANEKFLAIDGTFASNALALTAALAAQKEAAAEQNKSNTLAITKSEQATKETISANAAQTAAGLLAQNNNLQDIKERVVRIESMGVGASSQRTERRLDMSSVVAAIAVIVAVVSVIVVALKK